MRLADFLRDECILPEASFSDKDAVLHAVARLAGESPALADVDECDILKGLRIREELGTTGFGHGIAIPHARIPDIGEFVMGIVTVPDGVDFEAMDGKPVRLIVFVIAPESEATGYIRLLSVISQTLNIPGVIEEVVAQKTPATIRESFLRHTRDSVETKGHENKRIFHVIVQDEDIFHEILPVFEALESSSVFVVEAKNTAEYLSHMPLFAGFWGDTHLHSSRVIVAVVDKSLTNEGIRSIERITGPLDKRTDVMVTVQDILYAAGSLGV